MLMNKTTDSEFSTINEFRARLRGKLLRPGDDEYNSARQVWNGMIDKHPALIVRCAEVSDVVNAIRFARNERLTVAVRSGGHSVAGHGVCDGGLMIDLSLMKRIWVEVDRCQARAEAGVTTGEFLSATQEFGLATPTCPRSDVGLFRPCAWGRHRLAYRQVRDDLRQPSRGRYRHSRRQIIQGEPDRAP